MHYVVIISVCVRSREEGYTNTIQLSDCKAVMLQFRLKILSLRLVLCDLKDNILMNFMYIFRFLYSFCINDINVVVTFYISLYHKNKFYVYEFKIYTPCCTYFIITLRDICIYHYLLLNIIFGNISFISWREPFYYSY